MEEDLRTGNFRPKYAPLKNSVGESMGIPYFQTLDVLCSHFFAVNDGQRKRRGKQKLQILRLFDSGSAWSSPVTAGVCGDMSEGGAGVATDGTDETSPFCSSTLKGGSQIGIIGSPQMSKLLMEPHVSPVGGVHKQVVDPVTC